MPALAITSLEKGSLIAEPLALADVERIVLALTHRMGQETDTTEWAAYGHLLEKLEPTRSRRRAM